jgi:hypothetical protein
LPTDRLGLLQEPFLHSSSKKYRHGSIVARLSTRVKHTKKNSSGLSSLGSYSYGVYALAVSGSNLYVGGQFDTAGGVGVAHIAEWDGSAWSALSSARSGMENAVDALAVSGPNLYAGAYFTTVRGVSANYVAQWDGSAWSALGSGMNSNVFALAVSGTKLYAGGGFSIAGTNRRTLPYSKGPLRSDHDSVAKEIRTHHQRAVRQFDLLLYRPRSQQRLVDPSRYIRR